MQLMQFTDLGLRILMYLAPKRDTERVAVPITINEIANAFQVSRHHLIKIVHFLSSHGWLTTTRGKGGGLALSKPAEQYPLGEIVRLLEGSFSLVLCNSSNNSVPCALQVGCELKGVFDQAVVAFLSVLDRYTLADLVKNQTEHRIKQLHLISVL